MAATGKSQQGLNLAGQIFFGSLCAGTFGLGCWQVQRYLEKVELMTHRENDLAREPLQVHSFDRDLLRFNNNNNKSDDAIFQKDDYRLLKLQGRFDHSREFLVGPRRAPAGAFMDQPGSSGAGLSAAPQGYYVVTPFVLTDDDPKKGKHDSQQTAETILSRTILVNRGWVPRQLVVPAQPVRGIPSSNAAASPLLVDKRSSAQLLEWYRPNDVQHVTVIKSKPEQPKSFLVAGHELGTLPPRLFWFDAIVMQAAAGLPFDDEKHHLAPLVQAVVTKDDEDRNNDYRNNTVTWPIPAPAHRVGEFNVTPAIHASYAFTWFSLSAAGTYMTRKMMRR